MNENIVSRTHGWFLARVNASIENFANIIVTSLKTIQKYNLQPGRYIKLHNLLQSHPGNRFLDKFILLPYFHEFIENFRVLEIVNQSLVNATYHHVDKEYLTEIIRLMDTFYKGSLSKSNLRLKEFFEIEHPSFDEYHMNIGVPESW